MLPCISVDLFWGGSLSCDSWYSRHYIITGFCERLRCEFACITPFGGLPLRARALRLRRGD